jgi:type IV pilus assembly protein PilY1
MGLGGANRPSIDGCAQGIAGTCVKTPLANLGWSSYFALDVKDPANPKYLWEFSGDPANNNFLGAATTGPAIVRLNSGTGKNGKWFAVFASGPTGPIDTVQHQFMGTSNQNLKLFVVDLKTGALVRTIDTGVANAFAGTLSSAVIDTDRSNTTSTGFYSDDAVYIGYVKKDTSVTPNSWTKGGVLRLLTKDNPDPSQWALSAVIDNTGPVTTTITKLQNRKGYTLWLYFGTGRYFYKNDDPATGVQQKLYGIKEPCYSTANRQLYTPLSNIAGGTYNDLDPTCTDAVSGTIVDQSGDATTAPAATLSATAPGWFINLDAAGTTSLAERVITDPVALTNGNVFFTTFKPSADICKFGGDTLIWATRFDTGDAPPTRTMQGTALMQVSTGAFAEIKLSTAFLNPGNERLDGRRLATPIQGVPPTAQGLSLITNPKPVKKFIHVKEK